MAKSNLVDPEIMRTFFEVDDRNQLLENFLQSSKFWSTYKRLAPLYINTIRDLNGDGCSWKNKNLGKLSVKFITIILGTFSDDISCFEGENFSEGEICTLICRDDQKPTFAKLQEKFF